MPKYVNRREANRIYQENLRKRREKMGLTQVTVWVPNDSRKQVQAIARDLIEEHLNAQ